MSPKHTSLWDKKEGKMIIEQNGKLYKVVREVEIKDFLVDIAAQLRSARAISNMTLKEVSQKAKVSMSLISQSERAVIAPSLETLYKLCGVYGCGFVIRGK